MNNVSQKNIFLVIIPASFVLLALVFMVWTRSNNVPQKPMALPDDVETVVEGYKYAQVYEDLRIEMSGKKIIRRGRKVLGLRSNLIKSSFFQGIEASLRTKQGTVHFSASAAEWDSDVSHPFILKEDVVVSVKDRLIPNVKTARVFFKQGLLEVNAGRKEIYRFR